MAVRRLTPRRARVYITELNLSKRATIDFVDGKDKLLHFQITLRPDEGIYRRSHRRCYKGKCLILRKQ